MKKKLNKALALLLSLAMCMGLLPVNVRAADVGETGGGTTGTPTVTISDTPMLIKGDYQYTASDRTPFLSVSWDYGVTLPATYSADIYAWAGTETTRPSSYWKASIAATGSGGSFNGKLSKIGSSDPAEIYGKCMVQVALSYEGTTYTDTKQGVATVQSGSDYHAPVTVTIDGTPTLSNASTSSPSLSVGWTYDKDLTGDFSGMIYAWKDDGNNGSLPNNYWFQEYKDGNGGTSDSTTVTLRQQNSPAALEGDCWVRVSLGLSAQAKVESEPVKVNFGGGSSSVTYPEAGTDEWKAAMQPRVLSAEVLTYLPSNATGTLQLGITFDFPNLPIGGKIEDLPGFNGMHVVAKATHNGNTAQVNPGNARLSSAPETSVDAIGYSWDWAYTSGGACYAVKTYDLEPEQYLSWSSGGVNGVAVGDALDISMTANGIIRDANGNYADSYTTPNSASVNFTVADGIANQTFEPTSTPTLAINNSSFPEGTVGKSYGPITLSGTAASGGALSWSIVSGSLPAGLSLSNGTISGAPTAAGTSTFTLQLAENGGGTVTRQFTLKVSNAAPRIGTVSLPQAVKNVPYTIKLQGTASGGGSLSWSLQSGSSLPTGLTLATDGTISGTPADSLTATDYSFTVELAEANVTDKATQTFTLSVREPKTCTATFALNGGTGTVDPITVTEDGTTGWNKFTLPAAPERTGYVFNGWRWDYTNYSANSEFTVPDSMFDSTGSATLSFVAQWKDPDPVTVTYNGQIVGSYELRGKLSDGDDSYVYLGWGCADTPAASVSLGLAWSSLRSYTFESVGLWAYVDGEFKELASYDGEPAASVELTPKLSGLTVVTDVAAVGTNNAAMTRNTDFTVSYLYWSSSSGSRYLYLPFMTTQTTGFSAYVRGVSSSENYAKYQWNKSYDAAISGNTATVTLEKMPTGVTVRGTVKYGSGDDATPLSGVQVQFSQYAYNQSLNFTATTDKDGKYEVTGLIPGHSASWSVLSGGQRLESGTIGSNNLKTGVETTQNITVNTAVAVLNVSLDLPSSLNYAQRSAVMNALWRGKIAFKQTNSSGTSLGTDSLELDDSSTHYIHNVAANDTVYYEITGGGVETTPGSFTLSNGVANESITVKPSPGVVVKVTSPTYCKYALAWFQGESFVGASDALYFSSSGRTMFAAAPGGAAGTYTVALVPYTAVGAIDSESNSAVIHTWSVTLGENEIKALADFTVSRTASEDAAYATKPNSTLTADRESFSSTADLVRFTGSIGLDSGLTSGRLNYLKINVKNEADNVSYSNTAAVQYVVLGGKLYSASDFDMASTGYYYMGGLDIDLPCEYTIYCKPGDADWDMQLSMYANVSYTDGSGSSRSEYDQLIGSATVKKPGASITTLSTYVCSDTIAVKGAAAANGTVDIYDGETLIGSATANSKGVWEARVTLANAETPTGGITAENCYATTHVLTSRTASGARSDELYVFHDPSGPELTSFRMAWSRNPSGIDVGDSYVYAGGMSGLTFTATFKHPDKLYATVYEGESTASRVSFQYYLTNGTVGVVNATGPDANGAFIGKLDKTVYSSVTSAEVIYDPILNEKPATIDCTIYPSGEAPAGTVMDQGEYEWSESELASLGSVKEGTVAAAFNHTRSDNFTVTFDNSGAVDADALKALLIPDEGKTIDDTEKQEVVDGFNDYAAFQKDNFGMVPQSYSVKYNDVSTVQWLRDSASNWLAKTNRGTGENQIPFALYSRTYTIKTEAAYDTELTQLKALNTPYHYTLQQAGNGVTGEEFIFTDATFKDGDIEDGTGTFFAVVTAYKDTANGVYEVDTELVLMSKFEDYGSVIPSTVAYARLLLADPVSGGGTANNQSSTSVSVADGASYAGYATTGVKGATKTLSKGKLVNTLFKTGNTAEKITTGLTKATSVLSKVGTGIDVLSLGLDTYNYVKYRSESPENAQKMHDQVEQIANSNEFKLIMEKLLNNPQGYTETWGNQWRKDEDGNVVSRGGDSVTIPTVLDRLYTMMSSAQYWAGDDLQRSTAADVGMAIKAGSTGVGFGGAFIPGVGWVVAGVAGGVNIVGGGICDMMSGSLEQTRLEEYKRFMENWQYLVNYYETKYGFPKEEAQDPSGGGSGGGTGSGGNSGDSGASASRAREMIDNGLTRKPPITNKVSNDPAGVVFEGVIENPVEGATVTLYYAAKDNGDVVLQNESLDLATQLLRADDMDDLIPSNPVQTTGADGRYSWGVPEGLWCVAAQYGGLTGSSNADTAATVSKELTLNGTSVNKLLPVLPVQLDVNIPLEDKTAPVVTDMVFEAGKGVYVTFSKYMDETTCLNKSNYTLTVNGSAAVITEVTSVEGGSTPKNLGEVKHYTKTVLLNYAALAAGDTVDLTVKNTVKSYAGTALGSDYTTSGTVESQEKLGTPSVRVNSTTAGAVVSDTVAVNRGDALFLTLPDGAPASAEIIYQIDSGTEQTFDAAAPIVVNSDFTLKFWAEALGYPKSDVKEVAVKSSGNTPTMTAESSSVSVTAGSTTAVTLTLKDKYGNPMSGSTINASSGDASVATVTASATTNANGQAVFTVTGVKAGGAALTFTVSGAAAVTAAVSVTVTARQSGDSSSTSNSSGNTSTSAESIEVTLTPTVSGGKAEAGVTASEVAAAVQGAESGDTLTFKVESENAGAVSLTIPAQAVQTVASADVEVAVATENGTVKLGAKALEALAGTGAGAEVSVTSNGDGTTTFDVTANGETVDATLKIELPAAEAGQVLVLVLADGTEKVVKKSAVEGAAAFAEIPAGATVRVADNEKSFPDVAENAWYASAVGFASSHELFQGTGEGFAPAAAMNRAMLATVLYRLEDASAAGQSAFADVADGAWYADAVAWASETGIVTGTGSGFAPETDVTREQIATMFYRYADTLGLDTGGSASLDGFTDGGETAPWASGAMRWAVGAGLFQGSNGALNPKGSATRAEVATLFERLVKLIVK